MLKTLLLLLAVLQNPAPSPPELGIIAGNITPSNEKLPETVRVVLLSPQYAELWASEVQKRLDVYWERYKPAFAQKKEFFFEVSRMAHRDALEYVITRMQRDARGQGSNFIQTSGPTGKFEFKDIPLGEYRIVAIGKVAGEDILWQEAVDVINSAPQFVQLKKLIP